MWYEILGFMVASYKKFKSETLIFLYFDETKDQPWSYWVPPQITNGMTVKSDPESEKFKQQRALYPDTMFGTVHHHCSSSAFQSGTDSSDETNREGFHFTIGNCDKDEVDVHLRVTLGNTHTDVENLSVVIDGAESPFKDNIAMTEEMIQFATEYMNQELSDTGQIEKRDWSEAFENVEEQKRTYTTSSYYGSGVQDELVWNDSFKKKWMTKTT